MNIKFPEIQDLGEQIGQGFQKAAQNLATLSIARRKLAQDDEMFKLNKKESELKIKKMELIDMDPDTIAAEKEKTKTESDLKKTQIAYYLSQINNKTKEERLKFDQFKKEGMLLNAYQKGKLSVGPGQSFRYGEFSISKQKPNATDGPDWKPFPEDNAGQQPTPTTNNELDTFLSGFSQ